MMDTSEQKERDRSRRSDRNSRFSESTRDRSRDKNVRDNCVYVSNIPYEYRWNEVKDLFRKHVGDVLYVELFNDENNKPRGCGIVEFSNSDSVKKAMEVMHRFSIDGRKLVIKEDFGNERDKFGFIVKGNRDDSERTFDRSSKNDKWTKDGNVSIVQNVNTGDNFNTYGLCVKFLESIGVRLPLCNRVFVANLDYDVEKAKLKEIFKMAGKIRNIEMGTDKEGNSRGFAVIEYDHPVEAVQAISMFDKQFLFDRKMTVRMDRVNADKKEIRLPAGLKDIGLGLGPNGQPLHDVAKYINQNSMNGIGVGLSGTQAGILGAMPTGLGLGSINTALANPIGNNTLAGNLALQNLGLGGLGNLQNQILQQGLATGDLGLGSGNGQGIGIGGNVQDKILNGIGNGNIGAFAHPIGVSQNTSNFMASNNVGRSTGGGNMFGNNQDGDMNLQTGIYNRVKNDSDKKECLDTIYISNLPSSMTWQLVREKFNEVGEVKFVDRIGSDAAIIRYPNQWIASQAIKTFDRTRIGGRTINVRFH